MQTFAQLDQRADGAWLVTGTIRNPMSDDPPFSSPTLVDQQVAEDPDHPGQTVAVEGTGHLRQFVAVVGAAPIVPGETTWTSEGGFVTPTPPTPARLVSTLSFLRVLHPAEYAAWQDAATAGDGICFAVLGLLDANWIDPDDPLLRMGLQHAVDTALITAPRRDAIVAALAAAV